VYDPVNDETYTLTKVPLNGDLQLEGTTLNIGDTFTELDITSGLLSYNIINIESTQDDFTFNIEVPPQTLPSAASIDSTAPIITFDSVYDPFNDETYTLTTVPLNGDLQLEGTTLNIGDTFTELDITSGRLSYNLINIGSTQDDFTFNIEVPPQNTSLEASIDSSDAVTGVFDSGATISFDSLYDQANDETNIIYTLTAVPLNGTLHLDLSIPDPDTHIALPDFVLLEVGSTFTQFDITSGRLIYEKTDGTSTEDSFAFDIEAPLLNISSEASINNSRLISFDSLYDQVNDETTNTPGANFIYTLTTAPLDGDLQLGGTTLNVGDTFTQSDITSDLVTYEKTQLTSTQDSFTFDIEVPPPDISSEAAIDSTAPIITFDSAYDPVNDETYTLTTVPLNGDLQLEGTTLNIGDTFTELDITSGRLSYNVINIESAQDDFTFNIEVPPPKHLFRSSY